MPEYLVEAYLPTADGATRRRVVATARSAAEEMARTGTAIRYLRSIFVPTDETCFHLFDAPSAELVREASERAGLGPERIVEAIQRERG
jgi:Protein of unknown function (DUF4242)